MKFIFTAVVALALGQSALACSPAKDLLQVQPGRIAMVIGSSEVVQGLRAMNATDIKSIEMNKDGTIKVSSSNGCSVTAKVKMKQSQHPGMCGQTDGIQIVESSCEEQRSISDYLEGA